MSASAPASPETATAASSPAPAPAPGAGGRPSYERRRPEDGTLHRVVRENLRTLYAAVEEGFAGAPLPGFVRRALEGYLDCGLLQRGFALIACGDCTERRLVAFACKSRAFCPSCLGRRMAQGAANLLDHVLPKVGLRQFVLTVPFPLRARLAYDGKLLSAVGRVFVDSVLGWYRRRMRDHGAKDGRSGSVTVVQRVSSDLRLNPHWHAVLLDGVFRAGADGKPEFVALPRLTTNDVADLLQVIRARIMRMLQRRGVIETGPDATLIDDGLAERDPALAQLAAAAVAGLPPAGPELRRRPVLVALPGRPGVEISAPLSVSELGFSLHAATTAGAQDERGRAALVKYILRPPIAQERLHLVQDDLVRIQLRKPFRDGTFAIDLDPLSLLSRLAASVPPPRLHCTTYAGVLAAASKWRALVVPQPPPAPTSDQEPPQDPKPPGAPTHRCKYLPWAQLLRRTFSADVESCSRCGGKMKLKALVTDPASIARYLRSLGEPSEPPPPSPARAPPYYKSRVLRRKAAPHSAQTDLFDE